MSECIYVTLCILPYLVCIAIVKDVEHMSAVCSPDVYYCLCASCYVSDCCVYACQLRLMWDEQAGALSTDKNFPASPGQESIPVNRLIIPEGKQFQAGCIIFSVSSAMDTSTSPSRQCTNCV